MNERYSLYRQIRYQRAYKTLGKMSWWRIVLGVALLILALFISGVPAKSVAARGHFVLADKLIVSDAWMVKYKPELKAFIDAGVLYENGDYAAAESAFAAADDEASQAMRSVCLLRMAEIAIDSGDYDTAYDHALSVNTALLSDAELEQNQLLCDRISSHYRQVRTVDWEARCQKLEQCA